MAFTLLFLTVIRLIARVKNPRPAQGHAADFPRRFLLFPLLAGISSGFDHSLWASALGKTSVSNAAMLNGVAPLWIALIALIFLKEKFSKKFAFGLIGVFLGMLFLSGEGFNLAAGAFNQGDQLALLSSFFYAGYYIFTQLGRKHLSTLTQMWISLLFCTLTIGAIVWAQNLPLFGYNRQTWINFLLIALISQLCGYYFITYALGCLPASIVSPSNELQPVISSLLAIPILHESLAFNQIIGCAAILAGVFLINQSKLS